MNKHQILSFLTNAKPELIKRFNISSIAVFGSTVRNEANDKSDIDILVSFSGKSNAKNYFGLQFYLEDRLESPIDLVTEKALRDELRPYIEKEAIYV